MVQSSIATPLDTEAFTRTPLEQEPFPWLFVPRFVRAGAFDAVFADFPHIDRPGSYPADELTMGPAFRAVLNELEQPFFRSLVAAKFGIDLSAGASMITVRGQIALRNGDIHADADSKLITILIYFNRQWDEPGGRLRILRSSTDIDDYVAEIPPVEGNLVAFRVTPNSWHGHLPASAPRRAIQLNWMVDESIVRRELRRHRISARLKTTFRLRR